MYIKSEGLAKEIEIFSLLSFFLLHMLASYNRSMHMGLLS